MQLAKVIKGPSPQSLLKMRKVAIPFVAFGRDLHRIMQFTGIRKAELDEIIDSHAFIELIARLRDNPDEILPNKEELYALLIVEAKEGDRSTDRQRAIDSLLEIHGTKPKRNIVENFKR